VVLVDIGGGTMSIAIFIEGALSYSQVIPVGAINVTKDLAAGLRISLESSETLKLFLGKDKSKDDEIDVSELHLPEEMKTVSRKTLVEGIIRPRLNEMFQLIAGEIKKSGFAGLTPSGVVITGGGALTIGIVDSAKRILAMPVRVGTPMGISGLIEEIENPGYAVAVGLIKHAAVLSEDLEASGPLLSSLPKFDGIPIKGMLGKVTNWIKSLLP